MHVHEADIRKPDNDARRLIEMLESEIELVRCNLAAVREMGDLPAVRVLEERLSGLLARFAEVTLLP